MHSSTDLSTLLLCFQKPGFQVGARGRGTVFFVGFLLPSHFQSFHVQYSTLLSGWCPSSFGLIRCRIRGVWELLSQIVHSRLVLQSFLLWVDLPQWIAAPVFLDFPDLDRLSVVFKEVVVFCCCCCLQAKIFAQKPSSHGDEILWLAYSQRAACHSASLFDGCKKLLLILGFPNVDSRETWYLCILCKTFGC